MDSGQAQEFLSSYQQLRTTSLLQDVQKIDLPAYTVWEEALPFYWNK